MFWQQVIIAKAILIHSSIVNKHVNCYPPKINKKFMANGQKVVLGPCKGLQSILRIQLESA